MPKLMTDDNMQAMNVPGGGNFQFSGIRPEDLEATEYTLVTLVVDVTGSVIDFKDDLLNMEKSIVKACQKHPRAENLLLRLIHFNSLIGIHEIHGFKPLKDIDSDAYEKIDPNGATPLYDAAYNAIGSTLTYAKTLLDQYLNVNAVVYILTDGENNVSILGRSDVGKILSDAKRHEDIDSISTILIGLDHGNGNVARYLEKFKDESGMDQFIDVGEATPQKLAKLANFVSQSVSSTSQALGTVAPSQQLAF